MDLEEDVNDTTLYFDDKNVGKNFADGSVTLPNSQDRDVQKTESKFEEFRT